MGITVGSTSPGGSTATGGTQIFVVGTGFSAPTATLGGTPLTTINVISSTMFTGVVPVKAPGTYPLIVTDTTTATINYSTWPISDLQGEQMMEVWGLPMSGKTVNTLTLVLYPFSNVDIWSPTWNKGDITAIIRDISANMSLLSASQIVTIQELLDEWAIVGSSEMDVNTSASQARGTLIDDEKHRRLIRLRLANIVGISVPKDGFLAEIEASFGKGVKEFRMSQGGGMGGWGDR